MVSPEPIAVPQSEPKPAEISPLPASSLPPPPSSGAGPKPAAETKPPLLPVPSLFSGVTESPDPSSVSESPVILTSALPGARVGEDYSVFITASGGGQIYSWKIILGSIPFGLSALETINCGLVKNQVCHPAYEVSGKPNASGKYNFRIAVSDGKKAVYKDYSISVEPANLKIEAQILPKALVGVGYDAEISGSGGSGSYAWSIINSNLPPEISFVPLPCNGSPCKPKAKITGTPRGIGNYKFTAILESGTQSASREFSLTVEK